MTKRNSTAHIVKKSSKSYGVGFNSKGKHPVKIDGKITDVYHIWRNMLRRCYDPKTQAKRVTYVGCSVDERWHDYQDFAEWCYGYEYRSKGYELDKDLLVPNNKVYSPDTCCFVPQELNTLLNSNSRARGDCPQGVSWDNKGKEYRAQIKINNRVVRLGGFDCPQAAYQVYKEAKEAYVRQKALEWKGRVADDVFHALLSWRLED